MTLRTLWNTGRLATLIATLLAIQAVAGVQDNDDSDATSPTAACATPASSRSTKEANSVPYSRPAFHQPKPNQSSPLEPDVDLQTDEFESAIEAPIIKQTDKPRLPQLNPLQNEPSMLDVPELNAPRDTTVPLTFPMPALPMQVAPMPTPGPDSSAPTMATDQPISLDVGQFDDLSGVEFNFSDAGCNPAYSRSMNCPPGVGRRLMPLRNRTAREPLNYDQQAAEALWPNCRPGCQESALAQTPGISANAYANGTGIAGKPANKTDIAQSVPGLMPGNTGTPMTNVSNPNSINEVQLPESRIGTGQETAGGYQSNNGITIHPPMLQPFNRHQHTFLIENRGDAVAEDVVIEISVKEGDRIIAALPENSVTSDKVSMFKFPKIVAGESIPIHVTAVSDSNSPIEFSASLISRAVYSFHIQEGQQQGKLSNVSYLNDKSQSPFRQSKKEGPVRVKNPFFGYQPRRPNQAAVPMPNRRR